MRILKGLTDASLLYFIKSAGNPAGISDNNVYFITDECDTIYQLSYNTSLNYAGLSRIKMCDSSWHTVIFVQVNQHEHVAALNYCDIVGSESYYADGLEMNTVCGEETCDSLDIARLCQDFPESMLEYFMQWE